MPERNFRKLWDREPNPLSNAEKFTNFVSNLPSVYTEVEFSLELSNPSVPSSTGIMVSLNSDSKSQINEASESLSGKAIDLKGSIEDDDGTTKSRTGSRLNELHGYNPKNEDVAKYVRHITCRF